MSRRMTLKCIVQSEEFSTLQSVVEITAAWYPGSALGDVETPAVQVTEIPELGNDLEAEKRE